jgi:hypothetical protein
MNLPCTPILANGMIMFAVFFHWAVAMLIVGFVALAAIILASIHRTREATRWLPLVSLVASGAPLVVLMCYHKPIASYGLRDLPVLIPLSMLPFGMSALAFWLSRRPLPETQPPAGKQRHPSP